MAAATRTARCNRHEPGNRSMTRHGTVEPSTAGAQPTATDPRTPIVTVPADRLTTSNVPRRLNRAEAQDASCPHLLARFPMVIAPSPTSATH